METLPFGPGWVKNNKEGMALHKIPPTKGRVNPFPEIKFATPPGSSPYL